MWGNNYPGVALYLSVHANSLLEFTSLGKRKFYRDYNPANIRDPEFFPVPHSENLL